MRPVTILYEPPAAETLPKPGALVPEEGSRMERRYSYSAYRKMSVKERRQAAKNPQASTSDAWVSGRTSRILIDDMADPANHGGI